LVWPSELFPLSQQYRLSATHALLPLASQETAVASGYLAPASSRVSTATASTELTASLSPHSMERPAHHPDRRERQSRERHKSATKEHHVRFTRQLVPPKLEATSTPAPTGEGSTSELCSDRAAVPSTALFTQPRAVALLTFSPSEAFQPLCASRSPPLSWLASYHNSRSR